LTPWSITLAAALVLAWSPDHARRPTEGLNQKLPVVDNEVATIELSMGDRGAAVVSYDACS
jgi:hypothetical protein